MINQVVCRKGLIVSGQANNGGVAGSFFAHSNNDPSTTNANHGSHLCFSEIKVCAGLAHTAKNNFFTYALVLKRKMIR